MTVFPSPIIANTSTASTTPQLVARLLRHGAGAPLWGDMTALPEVDGRYVIVSHQRGQQPNEVDQLDSWLHDGSAAYLESLCEWE